MAKIDAVTMKEITAIFEITDRLGISREAIEIPLSPDHPGRVNALPNGKYEIIVESDIPIEQWVATLEKLLTQSMGQGTQGGS
jgi:hypothetical protein